jgi:hypothetical protein
MCLPQFAAMARENLPSFAAWQHQQLLLFAANAVQFNFQLLLTLVTRR